MSWGFNVWTHKKAFWIFWNVENILKWKNKTQDSREFPGTSTSLIFFPFFLWKMSFFSLKSHLVNGVDALGGLQVSPQSDMDVSEKNRYSKMDGEKKIENLTKNGCFGGTLIFPWHLEASLALGSFPFATVNLRKLDWLLCYARWLQPCVMVNGNSCWAQVLNRKASNW